MVTIFRPPAFTGLSPRAALDELAMMLKWRKADRDRLDVIHDYLRGNQKHPVSPTGSPPEVTRLAKMSRVNIMDIVVSSVAQTMYVDGYRAPEEADDAPAWEVWQANKMDARQSGVHRAALAYGTSYVTVLPGDPVPVLKGYSPRRMTAIYGDDDNWPNAALSAEPSGDRWMYRLYDTENVYIMSGGPNEDGQELEFLEARRHGLGVVPVVRFLNVMDLDEDNVGEIEPLMELQDQIDLTTFSLLVAQHYGAFRQRWIIGWLANSERELMKVGASQLMAFEDGKEDIQIGEFGQTDLKGYLESREASLRHAATISQTPVHELIGQMVNLSAEALVAAEAGQRRKVTERQMSFGESWEQVLQLAGDAGDFRADEMSQVRWRDTESRALSATVDALGKMAQMLGVPPQELWERIPGVSQQDVERWKATFAQGDALGNLAAMLDRQMGGEQEGDL